MYNWFKLRLIDFPLADLSPAAVATFLTMSAHQDEEGFCAMSYGCLAKVSGFARRTTIQAVKELVTLKLIRKITSASKYKPLTVQILACSAIGDREIPYRELVNGEKKAYLQLIPRKTDKSPPRQEKTPLDC